MLGGADLAEEVGWNDGGELFFLQPVHVQAPHHVLHAGCRTRLHNFEGQCHEMNNFFEGLQNQINTYRSICLSVDGFYFVHLNCLEN